MEHLTYPPTHEKYVVDGTGPASPEARESRRLENGHRARQRLEERLRAVAEVNEAIHKGGPSDEVLSLIARRTRQLVDAAATMILLPEESGDLTVRASDGEDMESIRGMRLPAGTTLASAVIKSGEARMVTDLSREPLRHRRLAMSGRFGPALIVALKVRTRRVGVIEVANDRGSRQFTGDELETVRLFTAQVGLALEAHLSREVVLLDAFSLERRSTQVREQLQKLAPAPAQRGEFLRQTLDTLARTVVELTDSVACSFELLEPDLCARSVGSSGLPEELLTAMNHASRLGAPNAALEAIASGDSILVTNERDRILADVRYHPPTGVVRQLAWSSVACLPLATQAGIRGALCCFFDPERRPDDAELGFLRVMAAQAATVVDNAQLVAATSKQVAMEERQHLARELHDSVSQALYGIALGARTMLEQLEHDPVRAREPADYVLQLAETGLAEMRALIFELRPESLESEGLAAALVKQTDAVRARNGISVETSIDDVPDSAIEVHQALYRIAQEALHNAAKHAAARKVEVRLSSGPSDLTLDVVDDGIGFEPDHAFPGHLGLRSMRERATALGGTCEISSRPSAGTHVHATVPRFPR